MAFNCPIEEALERIAETVEYSIVYAVSKQMLFIDKTVKKILYTVLNKEER